MAQSDRWGYAAPSPALVAGGTSSLPLPSPSRYKNEAETETLSLLALISEQRCSSRWLPPKTNTEGGCSPVLPLRTHAQIRVNGSYLTFGDVGFQYQY